ncbi:zinc finger, CCHC-type containing protein [Tanacetum coccineum]
MILNGTEDIGGSVVPEEVTEKVVQQPKPELRKSKKNRTPKNFGPEFQLYLIEGTMDESYDVAFWKEAFNDEMDSIMSNNTWVLADLPPVARISTIRLLIAMASIYNVIIYQMDVKTTFLNGELEEEVYMNQPQGFNMPGNENKVLYERDRGADVILGIRIKHESNGVAISQSHYIKKVVSQLEYSRVIGCLMYAMTCTRPDIAFVVGKLSSNTKDNSSTSSWVFLLGGGAISWASKKQTCITGSTIESEFVALVAAGKEAECTATLAKAYSQMYNGKSRHLGVRHSMIRELITNGVVSIEFVRSQKNLADQLTKGLARDLVLKSAEGMGLKSNQVAEC